MLVICTFLLLRCGLIFAVLKTADTLTKCRTFSQTGGFSQREAFLKNYFFNELKPQALRYFDANKNIYLQTKGYKNNEDYAKIFKYDAKLTLKWEKRIEGKLTPIQIIATSDNGILAACIELGSDFSQNTLRLYKLNADGDITAVTTLGTINTPKNLFYPNPFQSQLTLKENIEGASEVQLFDINGRIVGIFTLNNNVIEVNSDLPKGTYIAQIKDEKGKILERQIIVKQ